MSQRVSGYRRIRDEAYETVAWPVAALLSCVNGVEAAWDPCDRHHGRLVSMLRHYSVTAVGTSPDFFNVTAPPSGVDSLITNPPYGVRRRGETAMAFIEHALWLKVPRIAMLLRVDFDSALGRQSIFCRQSCAVEPHQVVSGAE